MKVTRSCGSRIDKGPLRVPFARGFAVLLALGAVPPLVHANVPLVPVAYLCGFTFLSTVRTTGLALICIVLLEALVLARRERIRMVESLKLSLIANGLSTFVGLGLFVMYSSSFCIIIFVIPAAWIFARMLRSILVQAPDPKRRVLPETVLTIGFSIVLLIGTPILGMLTIPGARFIMRSWPTGFGSPYNVAVAVGSALILLLIGFGLSVIAESYVISGMIETEKAPVARTVLWMNLLSYIVMIGASSFYIWTTVVSRGWYWHR